MDMTLKKMSTSLAKLWVERDKIQEQAEAFQKVIDYYEQHPDEIDSTSTTGKEVDEGIIAILHDEGKPVHRDQIHDTSEGRGIKVAGQDPVADTEVHLSLMKTITSSHGNGFNPVDMEENGLAPEELPAGEEGEAKLERLSKLEKMLEKG